MDGMIMSHSEPVEKVDAPQSVAAGEFTHNFGRYKIQAQHQAVPVSSHGTLVGYFVSAREYEELLQLKAMHRRVISTAELSQDEADAIFSSRMHPRHDPLNKILDPK